jgi:hypothetical protein
MTVFMMLVEFLGRHDRQVFHQPIIKDRRRMGLHNRSGKMDSSCGLKLQIVFIIFKFIVMGQSSICRQSPHPFSIDIMSHGE